MLRVNYHFDNDDIEIWLNIDGWYSTVFKHGRFIILGTDRDKPLREEYVDYVMSLGLKIKNV